MHSPPQCAPSCECYIQDQKKELTSDGDECADKEESLFSAYLDGVQTISETKEEPAFKKLVQIYTDRKFRPYAWTFATKCEHYALFYRY